MAAPLSGHAVLRAHVVVQNFPLRITAADAWGRAVVVGTADGALVVFAEADEQASPSSEPQFEARHPVCFAALAAASGAAHWLHEEATLYESACLPVCLSQASTCAQVTHSLQSFAPRGVQQLAVLEEEALLLCLSDGTLRAYTLPSFAPAAQPGAQALSRARSVKCVRAAACFWQWADSCVRKHVPLGLYKGRVVRRHQALASPVPLRRRAGRLHGVCARPGRSRAGAVRGLGGR